MQTEKLKIWRADCGNTWKKMVCQISKECDLGLRWVHSRFSIHMRENMEKNMIIHLSEHKSDWKLCLTGSGHIKYGTRAADVTSSLPPPPPSPNMTLHFTKKVLFSSQGQKLAAWHRQFRSLIRWSQQAIILCKWNNGLQWNPRLCGWQPSGQFALPKRRDIQSKNEVMNIKATYTEKSAFIIVTLRTQHRCTPEPQLTHKHIAADRNDFYEIMEEKWRHGMRDNCR